MNALPTTSKVIAYHHHGAPSSVAVLEEHKLPVLNDHDVLVRMKLAPINPADINMLEGSYGELRDLPAIGGNEGVGEVVACGPGVRIQPGQKVKPALGIGTWREWFVSPVSDLIIFPPFLADEQAAMLMVNPPTAWRMLEDFVPLQPGDWLVQNGATSAVGQLIIQLAHQRGIHTINLVRRRGVEMELRALGADIVLVEDKEGLRQLAEMAANKDIRLGLNCIGGESAAHVAKHLVSRGTMVTYGAMSRQPFRISTKLLIFKDLRVRGFWLTSWYRTASQRKIDEMFHALYHLFAQGKLQTSIARTYSIEDYRLALAHATTGGRGGKILLKF